ncbi:sugar phosphate isomerase/epimerase [Quadrisphaera sp. INWT6]|uniref:sugar phosphate isomerase/epimerase family protein n=1 Tax=Quadrisphaera sp. INWT6 TaxID=2596917 RepID=UPI001891F4FD|nr:sugar phosphate isomerase/epimerase family protein [Quadrisphaera sp. INWT6]MBF5082255.1 sugar phosphate isomerase/epimerase [Quadrisphaera sp. INWT6]
MTTPAPARTAPDPSTWPIGAALLQAPPVLPDGTPAQEAPEVEWRRVLRRVRLAGFDHVDLTDSWVRPGDLSPERLGLLKRLLAEEGLGVTAITTARRSPIAPDAGEAAANQEYLERTLVAAAELGTSVVSAGLLPVLTDAQRAAEWFWLEQGISDPDPESDGGAAFDLAVERFAALGRRAGELGLQLSLEMYEDTYLGTPESSVRLKEAVGLPNVGLNPDVANIIRLHRPVQPWREQLAAVLPHANFWHVKNYYRDHDPATGSYATAPAPLALGVIDYRWAVEEALRVGFTGPFCCEHYGGDGLSVAAQNREHLRHLLASATELLSL